MSQTARERAVARTVADDVGGVRILEDEAPSAGAATFAQDGGQPLTQVGLAKAADSIGTDVATIWALVDALSAGSAGFLADRSPFVFFDAVQFQRETRGRFPELSAVALAQGGFGFQHWVQYLAAAERDPVAAVRATRWGLGQVPGTAFSRAGYESTSAFAAAMAKSEDEQLGALIAVVRRRQFDIALRTHDWSSVARELVGPDYREDEFDRRLSAAHYKFSHCFLPDVTIRTVQIQLRYLGYDPGPMDGTMNAWTRSAIAAFTANALGRASYGVDRKLLVALRERTGL